MTERMSQRRFMALRGATIAGVCDLRPEQQGECLQEIHYCWVDREIARNRVAELEAERDELFARCKKAEDQLPLAEAQVKRFADQLADALGNADL